MDTLVATPPKRLEVKEKSLALVDYFRSGAAAAKAKVKKMKAEVAALSAIKEVRDEFISDFLSGLTDEQKKALVDSKEFQKELASLTRESNKELNQSTELYGLIEKIGTTAVKAMIGIAGAAIGVATGGIATGTIVNTIGDFGMMAASGNKANTANFEFNAGQEVNAGLADEISILQAVITKLKGKMDTIVSAIESGDLTKDQIKDLVKQEVKNILEEVKAEKASDAKKTESSESASKEEKIEEEKLEEVARGL